MSDIVERLHALEHMDINKWSSAPVRNTVLEARKEIEKLRTQSPEGMKHCTILFKECEKGHGRLTATNWVQHGCAQCEIERLCAALEELAVLGEQGMKPQPGEWLTFHDKVAKVARDALSPRHQLKA